MGFTGMMVRWYESYLIGADVGHIPVSNLYEVFILFCHDHRHCSTCITSSITPPARWAPFVLLVISAAVGFLLWYTIARDAQPTSSRWCRRCKAGG